MENQKDKFKVVRELLTDSDFKNMKYSKEYVYSVLIGRRVKNEIVNQSIDIAIGNLYKKLVQLQSLKNEFSLGFEMEFIQMSEKEQIEYLCSCANLKQIQELKIQLIKLELFEQLGNGCKAFLNDLHKNKLKLLRTTRRFY
jgi:hypothetical protein